MLCMVFGQLTARESMRDLMLSLEAHTSKYYHLGFGSSISRRNLGKANQKRNYKIFEAFAYVLIEKTRESCYKSDFELNIKGNVYAFDSSTIDSCLGVFWWAEFRKTKAGIKLHTLYDVKTSIPAFVHITNARAHDVSALDLLVYEVGSFYVLDRAYVDFERLYLLHRQQAFFVTRAKTNMKFNRMYSNTIEKTKGIKYDQIGKLASYYTKKSYPEKLRRIKYYDNESKSIFIFLTNNMDLKAEEICYTIYN